MFAPVMNANDELLKTENIRAEKNYNSYLTTKCNRKMCVTSIQLNLE